MKDLVDYFQSHQIIFQSLTPISPKEIGSRKKLELYIGINLDGYYVLVVVIRKKSRILQKEAYEIMQLREKLQIHIDSAITISYILVDAPLCSKAKAVLMQHQWHVFVL